MKMFSRITPCTPDLTPQEFLWRYLKDNIYGTKLTNSGQHRMRIRANTERNVFLNVSILLLHILSCLGHNGHQFENRCSQKKFRL